MGREVRRVPADWQHPKDKGTRHHKPLYPGENYDSEAKAFLEKANADGLQAAVDYFGSAPDRNNFMPNWPESDRTHYMMYEDTSEGTPISPAFATPEKLARWLADTGASAFGDSTATYEQWLCTIQTGSTVSAVFTPETGLISGVEASCALKGSK